MLRNKLNPHIKIIFSFLSLAFISTLLITLNKIIPAQLTQLPHTQAAVLSYITESKDFPVQQVYNQDGSSSTGSVMANTAWLGTGNSIDSSYTGLAFQNILLPANSIIDSAELNLTSSARNSKTIKTRISLEDNPAPSLFNKKLPPSKRTLSTTVIPFETSSLWVKDLSYAIPNFKTLLTPVLTPGQSKNLNVIIKGTGVANTKKTFYSTNYPTKKPFLRINYKIPVTATPSATLSATPSPSPTSPSSATPSATPSSNPNTIKIRVLEVRYFPFGEQQALYHPDTLSQQLKTLLRDASSFHKFSNPNAQPSIEVETVAVYNYNTARPNPNGTWRGSYDQILAQNNLCQQIVDQQIDQLWVWADPRTGYDTTPGLEYVISSKYFQDYSKVKAASVAVPMFCGGARDFTFFEFDFSRTADLALHSFGHYIEGLIGNLQSLDLFWKTFSGDPNSGTTRSDKCGNVHFPPNGAADYDYANTANVTSSCEDWNPQLTGANQTFNCTKWNCNQEGYLQWWMQNMPNLNNNLTYQNKKLPSWWDFIDDTDATIKKYNDDPNYYIDRQFLGTVINPNLPEITSLSKASQNSGTSLSWQHQNTGTNTLLLVSASYRAHNNPSAQINSLTFNNLPLTKVRRDSYADRATEIWYLVNPPQGTFTINNQFSADPESQMLTAVSIADIDQTNPIVNQSGTGSTILNGQIPDTQSLTLSTVSGDLVFGVLTTYPDGGSNIITNAAGNQKIWNTYTSDMNIQSNGGAVRVNSSSTTISWSSAKAYSYGLSAVVLKKVN